ncbi:hypothetical protein [Actinoallomurus iriomotensis]|uniref:Tetratricopeptide repeat protein n=1 Tax=Actinoallomurus iriomotensis TaxID=478107 RepID=A0A9W6S4C7_9ACTN|nr:hypothetical protein [Actinoallomurus iriomotensis]GLY86986.1 hypothetical protein Airi02_049150 [Actinoallomurus iriomotensis]
MDPQNPVVRLCAEGMRAETEGRAADARALFEQAWRTAADDYEACVAAHYLARHQPTPRETLRWNQECLERANRVGDERVTGFYASLHLNLAKAHRDLDEPQEARRHFTLAAAHVNEAPPGPYADGLRFAIAEGLREDGAAERADDDALRDLLLRLCARRDLRALGLVLPAYLGDLGSEEDRARLAGALHTLHATRWLPEQEQEALGRVIGSLTAA